MGTWVLYRIKVWNNILGSIHVGIGWTLPEPFPTLCFFYRKVYIVGKQQVLVANIFTMLGSKNTWNSGKRSLMTFLYKIAISSFLIALKLGSESVVMEVDFNHMWHPAYFIRSLTHWFPVLYRRRRLKLGKVKVSF